MIYEMVRKIGQELREVYITYHLNYKCPTCPVEKQLTRDITGNGRCFWKEQWQNGRHDIPLTIGIKNLIRLWLNKNGRHVTSEDYFGVGEYIHVPDDFYKVRLLKE